MSINDIFSRVTSVVKSQITVVTSFLTGIRNIGNTALQYLQQKLQKFIQILTRDPKSKKDYFRIFGVYVSKKFSIISLCVAGVLGYLFVSIAWPWMDGRFWYAKVRLDSSKYTTFTGNAKVYDSQNVLVYYGYIENGSPSGEGIQYDSYGRMIYKGNFEGGAYTGVGELYNVFGVIIYTGNFASNKYEGEGKLFNDIGKPIYVGNFAVGQRSGKGVEYDPETGLRKYYGEWSGDVRSGAGIEYAENGDTIIYEGEFKDGVYEGEGKIYSGSGNTLIYSGAFSKGIYSGHGTLYDLDTGYKIYIGNFKDGLYEGDGKLYDPKTQNPIYEGSFLNGKQQGTGTLFDSLGTEEFSGSFNSGSVDYIKYLGEPIKKIEEEFGRETFRTEVDGKLIMSYKMLDISVVLKVDADSNAYACEKIILGTKKPFRGIGAQSTAVERRNIMGDPFTSLNFKCDKYYKTVFSDLAINVNNTNSIPADKYMMDKYFIRFYFNDGRTELKSIEICTL